MNETNYVPKICVWELTLRCNMRCMHCGSVAGKEKDHELGVEECMGIADDLLALGCRQVTFIGGEVFFYHGWERIAKKMSDGGATVNIVTNAFVMDGAQIDQIRCAKLANVGISLDGMVENHDRIRNRRGSFKRVLDAFKLLQRENIPVAAVTSLTDFNVSDLEPIYDLLSDHGVLVWQLQIATPMGNMAKNRSFLLDPAKIPLITRFIREKRNEQKLRLYAADNIGYFDENEMYLRNRPGCISPWQGCQAGLLVIGIDSIGNVKGCASMCAHIFVEGNLRQESLAEIWHRDGSFAYNRQFDIAKLTGKCADCDRGQICRGGCRAANYLTRGTPFESTYCCYHG